MKRLKYIVPLLILAIVIIGFGIYSWYQDAIYSPASSDTANVSVEVKEGNTVFDVAQTLQDQQAFKSVDAFRVYLKLSNLNPSVQKGKYSIPKNLNVPDLLALLGKGPKIVSVKATILEAIRYDEIAEVIEKAYSIVPDTLFKKSEFLDIAAHPDKYNFSSKVQTYLNAVKPSGNSLEGFLFPDTYNLGADANALDVVDLLVSTQLDKLAEKNINYTSKGKYKSFYEILTMASIVEREAAGLDDMKYVADILQRRNQTNIGLYVDATLLYELKRWTPGPNATELQLNSPYNTRKSWGLPPTPIDNPSINAIIAVLNPTPNQYFYYLTDREGEMRYAVTLSQHNANIAKYGVSGE